ncbi:hypothetical protein JZU69_04480 [bacterium]|nr:hypothetical protein [bacterium]
MPTKGQNAIRHDWDAIKAAYIEGCDIDGAFLSIPTLDQVATRFGCATSNLRVRAAKEQWTVQKSIYRARVEQGRRESKVLMMAASGAEFDRECFEAAKGLLQQVSSELQRETVATGRDKNYQVSLGKLKDLVFILEKSQKAGRLALGSSAEEVGHHGTEVIRFNIIGGGSLSPDFEAVDSCLPESAIPARME